MEFELKREANMEQTSILVPVIGMIVLTFSIAVRLFYLRIDAVKKGLNPSYFLLNRGAKPPEYLVKVEQHYQNLFELPMLFYIAVILIFVLQYVDVVFLVLAWSFFLIRIAHAWIHTTQNHLVYRRNAFLMGGVILLCIWIRLIWTLML